MLRIMELDTKQSPDKNLEFLTPILRCRSLGNICLPAGRKVPQSPQNNLFSFTVLNFRYLLGKMENPECVTAFWIQLTLSLLAEFCDLMVRYTLRLVIESLLLEACYIVGVVI